MKTRSFIASLALLTASGVLVPADAQPRNPTHEAMAKLSASDRNERLSVVLRDEGCRVTRSFFQGFDKSGGATWNVACAKGPALSILIKNDTKGSTRVVECATLKAFRVECFKRFEDQ